MIFAVVIVALSGIATYSADISRFASLDVSKVLSGEVWRLLSGNLTHLTWRQYAMDSISFLMLYYKLLTCIGSKKAATSVLLSGAVVSAAVVFTKVHMICGGMSGISCAVVSLIVADVLQKEPKNIKAYFIAVAFICYLGFGEDFSSGVNVAKEAHIAGAFFGLALGLLFRIDRKAPSPQPCFNRMPKISHQI